MRGNKRVQRESRRRTGCQQCKESHVQCTEERPKCKRCERLGLNCVRSLRLVFREDATQRDIRIGREGTWSKYRENGASVRHTRSEMDMAVKFQPIPLHHYVGRWIFLNFCGDDFESDNSINCCLSSQDDRDHHSHSVQEKHRKLGGFEDILSSHHSSEHVAYLQDQESYQTPLLHLQSDCFEHPLAPYSKVERNLLDYFIRGIGPQCSLTSAFNPYLQYVTPLCLHHEPVRKAVLAAAANQLCLLGDTRFQAEASLYKQKTLTGLRKDIAAGYLHEGTFATILMLCFRDISEGCKPSWATHLRGGLQLMEALKSNAKDSPASRFFMMYFIAHDIMRRTASESWSENDMTLTWYEDEDVEEVDMTMGCSRELMTHIDRITFLAQKKSNIVKRRLLTPEERDNFSQEVAAIKTSISGLDQRLPPHSAGRDDLMRIAETKRLAALLYLHERLGTMDSSEVDESFPSVAKPPPPPTRTIPAPSKRIVHSLINLISALPNSATLLWPLYVLGNANLDDEEHRRFVLDRLEGIEKTRNLGSVRLARMEVQNAFRRRDLRHPRGKVWGNQKFGLLSLA